MKIIHKTAEYTVVCKAAGEDSEHDLPEMLAEQNGDRATDYYVVHRLDQAVAGLLVLARNRVTAGELSRQLTEKSGQILLRPGESRTLTHTIAFL